MNFLFFDIECSNCFDGIEKMCEFGYVLCDENMTHFIRDDIPMSPGKTEDCRFNLKGRKGEKDIELAYDDEFYFSQPEFPHFYKRIKKLIEAPDTICFAYSMSNDIAHLYNSCKRYNLRPFNYICYDVQKLVSKYFDIKERMSLHNACREIVGHNAAVKLHEHLSRDDAEMERLVFDAICVLKNKKPIELLNESSFAKTNAYGYMKYIESKEKKKKEKAKGRELFHSVLLPNEEMDLDEYKGRRYNVSGDLKNKYDKLTKVIDIVKSKGGVFVKSLDKTDFLVVVDQKNEEDLKLHLQKPYDGQIITYDEFVGK